MAIRTQIRLPQITGSFGDAQGKIVDNLPVAATLGAIPDGSGSMVSAMSQLASSIQRIHGGAAFTTNAAGVFSHDIKFDANASLDFGDATNNAGEVHTRVINSNDTLVIDSAGAMTIDTDGNDAINIGIEAAAKTITIGNDASTKVDINALAIELDSAAAMTLSSVGVIGMDTVGTAAINIGTQAAAKTVTVGNDASAEVEVNALIVDINAAGTDANSLTIDSAGGIDMTAAAEAIDITASAAGKFININAAGSGTTQLVLTSAGTSAQAININATGTGGGVDIDANSAIGINSAAGVITLSGSNGATSVNVTSPATFGDNVVVTGTLTVNGTTTTVNSTTVTIDDPVFTLGGDTAPGSDDNKDRGIEFRYHDGSAARIGFFGFDDDTGKFTALTSATNTSEVFSGTKMPLDVGAINTSGVTETHVVFGGASGLLTGEAEFAYTTGANLLRVDHIQVDSATGDLISVEASDLTLAAAANLHLDAASAIELDNGSSQSVKFLEAGTEYGRIVKSPAGGISLRPAAGKNINLQVNGGNTGVEFVDGNNGDSLGMITGSAGANMIVSGSTTGDVIFNLGAAGGNPVEIARFDNSGGSLLMAGAKKIEFGDTATFIHQSTDGQLDIDADVKLLLDSPTVEIDAETAITLKSDAISIGEGGEADVVLTFSASTNNGELKWMEDEDYFEFSDDILVASAEKLQFRDAAAFINSSTANQLDLEAANEIELTTPVVELNNGAGNTPTQLRFMEDSDEAGGNYVSLRAHQALAGNVELIFPQAPGTANQVLALDNDSGQLIFQNPGATARKHVAVLSGPVVAGNVVSDGIGSGAHEDGFDLRSISADAMPARLDVFVNGQLLQSSSVAFGSLGSTSAGDYSVAAPVELTGVKFTFDLEADDTVSVIVR
jgi:hypothetical protein